jgi:hypothetical protein
MLPAFRGLTVEKSQLHSATTQGDLSAMAWLRQLFCRSQPSVVIGGAQSQKSGINSRLTEFEIRRDNSRHLGSLHCFLGPTRSRFQ